MVDTKYIEINTNNTLDLVKSLLAGFSTINFVQDDFHDEKWEKSPIENLFIDIAKMWKLSFYITLEFFTNLIPDKLIIIQQDMHYISCPWICSINYKLKENCEYLTSITKHSILFPYKKEVALDQMLKRYKTNLFATKS